VIIHQNLKVMMMMKKNLKVTMMKKKLKVTMKKQKKKQKKK